MGPARYSSAVRSRVITASGGVAHGGDRDARRSPATCATAVPAVGWSGERELCSSASQRCAQTAGGWHANAARAESFEFGEAMYGAKFERSETAVEGPIAETTGGIAVLNANRGSTMSVATRGNGLFRVVVEDERRGNQRSAVVNVGVVFACVRDRDPGDSDCVGALWLVS